ncbi:endonuclease domain-containing protein [Oerskovia gallyi]|uniref:DUF559 domain-containing protein n=1 Tax=Oerskovia gallyi TaxID=2762226 RepID=A0ABR8V704_9CELL|nr:DUF559 domain-containing protein [Oerskovia gallyi]MBD8000571.1 DUF559 domain-containing protein [Oerskovia gallyi]
MRTSPVPRPLRGGPFRRSTALSLTTASRLRGPAYRALLRGVHLDATEPLDHGTMLLAARAALGPDPVVCGRSAAWCWGARQIDATDPVEVVVPPPRRVRSRAQLSVRSATIDPDDVCRLSGYGLVTSPVRTMLDLARLEPVHVAVPLIDALLACSRSSVDEVLAAATSLRGGRGVRSVPDVLALCDAGAESPRETALRLLLVLAGLPRPVTQHVVRDASGRFVARVDLAWPLRKVAVEYDGAHHDAPDRIRRDRARLNALRRCGWTVLVVDRAQLLRPTDVVALVRDVLEGADRA